MSTILDHGVIQGSFTKQEVSDLADVLNSGGLPVRLKLVRIQTAESGEDKAKAKAQGWQQEVPPWLYPRQIDADAAGQEAIKIYDTNGDGKISGAEFDTVPSLASAQAMANFKSTKEKGITGADIAARIKAWQATKVGRIGGIIVQVSRNGKPLNGAEVKFVPEKFLGNLQECTGTTGTDGSFQMIAPPTPSGDPPGVPPGYYRVEITMPDGSIPAKYNTQTIFGEEVCPDVRRISGYQYDIK
jgi:hypothetical protein